jgi:PAS domain S-box-containing protein
MFAEIQQSKEDTDIALQAVGSAPVGIAVTSLAGSLYYSNDAFRRFFGIEDAGPECDDIRLITRGQLQEDFLISVAREGGVRQLCIPADGERALLCTAKRVMHESFPIYLSVVVQDITEIAAGYGDRWHVIRELLGTYGVGGPWSWSMRVAVPGNLHGNPIVWTSGTDGLFGPGLVPKTLDELMQRMAPKCRERVAAEIARAVAGRTGYSIEYELLADDGSIRPMRSIGRYTEGSRPREGRLVGVELELKSHEPVGGCDGMWHAVIEHMEVPVASIDGHLRFRYFNPAFAALVGGTGDKAPQLNQPVLNTVGDPARQRRLADVLRRVMKGEPSVFESEFLDDSGEVRQWIDFHFKPIRGASGQIEGAVAVGYDVSPLKRANHSHQWANAKLRQRLEHRVATIDTANRDLSNRVVIACDALRADLQRLRASLDPAAAASPGEDRHSQFLAAFANMESRIERLASLSEVGLRRPEWRRIDMNRLVREVLHDLAPMLEGRKVELAIDRLPHVIADRAMVRQVLQHLLSNAIKFTRGCAAARISISAAVEGGTTVWSVTDNGIGFDTRGADELFGMFVRRGTKPPGVGLSVAWRAIQQLNGRLWCESTPGQGTTFRFTIGEQEQGIWE